MLPDERIQYLIDTVVTRGGHVKDLHGAKNVYYQVNATYYSALGEDDKKMLLARAIQLFMPAKPQVWYLDLFCGKNDYEAVQRAGKDGHKEINRTNFTMAQVEKALQKDVVQKQLELLRLRATHPAFDFDATVEVSGANEHMAIKWSKKQNWIQLDCDLSDCSFTITKA